MLNLPTLRAAALGALALLATALPAQAASFDPDLKWRTITTEHFHIHFHQGEEAVAEEFSQMVEEVYDTMTEEVGWEPRARTHVTLTDRTDSANGFARVVPYNAITIYITAPTEDSTLNFYEDWSSAIFTHELTHILHMDANHGIVRAARAVVGRVASTNDMSPYWVVEGFATFQETRHTPAGRGRAAIPDMIKRTAALEDAWVPIDKMDGIDPHPPSGNARYLFGQDFIQWIADETGENTWTKWVHTYGSRIPYLMPTKKVFGRTWAKMYKDWKADRVAKYTAQAEAVRAEGETIGRLITPGADASCSAPAFSPNGEHLVWTCFDLKTGSAIWMSDGEGYAPEKLLQDRGAGNFTWRSDSKAFAYAGSHLVNRFNAWNDIYMHTLGGSTTALTAGARARNPDFSPDGSKLLYVTNKAQNNQLETMTIDRQRQRLTEHDDHTQYGPPRFSPSGEYIATTIWKDGRRDLWILDTEGQPVRRLTADTASETEARWSVDGKWLYFSSDRSGIPNIYTIEVATERLYQVTNVVTGAMRPSIHPSNQRVAFQQYSEDGWDIRILDIDPEKFIDRGTVPLSPRYNTPLAELDLAPEGASDDAVALAVWDGEPVDFDPPREAFVPPELPGIRMPSFPQSAETLDSFDDTEIDNVFGDEEDYPFTIEPHRYNPLPTLLPRYVLPYIQTTPFRPGPTFDAMCIDERFFCPSLQANLSTSSTDVLSRLAWSANINYRTDAEFLGGGAAITLNRWLPVYTFGASTRAVAAARLAFFDEDNLLDAEGNLQLFETDPPTTYWERRTSAFAQVSWPYKLRATLFSRYSFTERTNLFELPENTYLPAIPLRGLLGELSAGYRFSWSQSTPRSISSEDARIFSLLGSAMHPYLGSFVRDENGELQPFSMVQLQSEIREYVVNPLVPNHVFAGRLAGGASLGASDFLGNYQLGGSFGDSAFYVTPDSASMLRGYPFGERIGDMYYLGSFEYRFPIWHVQRGVSTIPFYVRTISGAAFIDAGNAFNNPRLVTGTATTASEVLREAVDDPLVGAGAEVSIRFLMGWGLNLQGRVGYGIGFMDGGFTPGRPLDPLYAHIGGSF